jgi:hypothetical protein
MPAPRIVKREPLPSQGAQPAAPSAPAPSAPVAPLTQPGPYADLQSRKDPGSYMREMLTALVMTPENPVGGSTLKLAKDTLAGAAGLGELWREGQPGRLVANSLAGNESTVGDALASLPGAFIDRMTERYGTPEAREKTVRDDPAGMVGDMLAIVGLVKGAGAARGAMKGGPGGAPAAGGGTPLNAASAFRAVREAAGKVPESMLRDVIGYALDQIPVIPRWVRDKAAGAMVKATNAPKPTPAAAPAPVSASAPVAAAPSAPPSAAPRVAGTPAAPAPTPAPMLSVKQLPGEALDLAGAARSKGQMSPSHIHHDVGLVAHRAKVTLSKDDFAHAETLVRQGRSPIEAVSELAGRQSSAGVEAFAVALNPDEVQAMSKLLQAGKTPQEAQTAIEAQRALAARLKTPTPAAVSQEVRKRQTTGRWSPDRPGTR